MVQYGVTGSPGKTLSDVNIPEVSIVGSQHLQYSAYQNCLILLNNIVDARKNTMKTNKKTNGKYWILQKIMKNLPI